MSTTTPDRTNQTIAAEAAKHAKWEVQRRVAKLDIVRADVGLLGMALNALRRRPSEFPSAKFARFRREVARQAPLDDADLAVVKLRADLLGSTIDARFSKPLTGADIDAVGYDAVRGGESRHGLIFDHEMIRHVLDAAWAQFAEFYGGRATGRAGQIAAAEGFVPSSGPQLDGALRDFEAAAIASWRAKPRR